MTNIKIISLHSFRRGVGKSTLVANLAAQLVQNGRSVGLFDINLQSPSLHLFFGLTQPEITLTDVLSNTISIKEAAYPVLLHENGGQLQLVPASGATGDIQRVLRGQLQLEMLTEHIEQLAEAYNLDLILLDTYAGLHEETLQAMAVADQIFILLRPDQQDFQGTAVLVDVAKRLNTLSVELIVNQCPPQLPQAHVRAEVEKSYGCTVTAVLPHVPEMLSLTSSTLFVQQFPTQNYTQMLDTLLYKL
ncbi:MAG: MinD/ParA family protein [Chloroflexota bacterium]